MKNKKVLGMVLREGDMSWCLPDIGLMKRKLKVKPEIGLEEGLKRTIAYLAG